LTHGDPGELQVINYRISVVQFNNSGTVSQRMGEADSYRYDHCPIDNEKNPKNLVEVIVTIASDLYA
jgi:hypothetical protein